MALYVGNTRYTPMLGNSRASFMVEDALPYDAEIEYLESSGTQRIDTGIMYDSSVVADVKLMALGNGILFGIYWDGGSGARRWTLQTIANNPGGYLSFGTVQQGVAMSKNVWLTINADYHKATINGSTATTSASAFNPTSDVEIAIFARHLVYSQNTYDNYVSMRLESFRITKGGDLVFDGIPVRVGQVGYLYDRVTETLFGNAGTGDFILGNDKN